MKRRNVRKNPPGKTVLVWVAEGEVIELPDGRTHLDAVPPAIAKAPYVGSGRGGRRALRVEQLGAANAAGYYRAAIINERIYVQLDGRGDLPAQTRRSLTRYCRTEGLSRGLVVERKQTK